MNPILVELTRGGRIESWHRGAIAVSNAAGRLVAQWGDVETPTFPRSAFKALQALPLIESGAADAFEVDGADLALAVASHSGEAIHVDRIASWLARIDCRESDLVCGPHLPFHEPAAHALLRAGERPCRLHNNCSGKHTGFLTLSRHMKIAIEGYDRPDHPVQLMVRRAIADFCDLEADAMPVGIDGCAAPNYAIPLTNLARAMARLGDRTNLAPERAAAAQRIIAAWKTHPVLVSGTGRACADLIEASHGQTVVKTGAEGVFVAVLPDQGLGVALKMDDGAARAAETALAKLLTLLKASDDGSPKILRHLRPVIRNWRGDAVGERRPAAALAQLPD